MQQEKADLEKARQFLSSSDGRRPYQQNITLNFDLII